MLWRTNLDTLGVDDDKFSTMVLAVLSVFLVFSFGHSDGCRLGYLMTKFTVRGPGDYRITCSPKPFPICPEHCIWTNSTCDDHAKRVGWIQDQHMLANISYSYPVREKGSRNRKGEKKHNSRQRDLPRVDVSKRPNTALASATPSPSRKSIQRQCCVSRLIHLRQCRTIDWKPNSTNGNTFDVAAYGRSAMQCGKGVGVVRDIKVKNFNENTFTIDACCLNHAAKATAVACVPVWEEAAIALAIALPLALALGIGIPLLFVGKCHEELFVSHSVTDGVTLTCYSGQTSRFVSRDQCCALCSNQFRGQTCLWAEGAAADSLFPGSNGRPTCSICAIARGPSTNADGAVLWYPLSQPNPFAGFPG